MNHDVAAIFLLVVLLWWKQPCNAWTNRLCDKTRQLCRGPTTSRRGGALSSSSSSWREAVAHAMRLSQEGESNITAAHAAVDLWERILKNSQELSTLSKNNSAIRGLCQTLYGTCLVRIGRDTTALDAFAQALVNESSQENACESIDHKTRQMAILGRAACWQRLLRYPEALEEYQSVPSTTTGTWGAVVCALRLGDASLARDILAREPSLLEDDPRLLQTSEVLQILETRNIEAPSSAPSSQVGVWLCHRDKRKLPSLRTMLEFNVGPFDDPLLIELDDKIHLHQLVSKDDKTHRFWPTSFAFPAQVPEFTAQHFDSSSRWIVKARSGYGSHGNTITTAGELKHNNYHIPTDDTDDDVLVQQLVSPPRLLNGRVFSVRIYVIYFMQNNEHYVSRHGLVKLAALPYIELGDDGNEQDSGRLMTNSGRDSEADQMEWQRFLEGYCSSDESETLQNKIASAVDLVMGLYHRRCEETRGVRTTDYRSQLACAGLPKIMGWDFLVDAAGCDPWLMEVNRFPGLEARDEQDARIKQAILEEAWKMASDRRSN